MNIKCINCFRFFFVSDKSFDKRLPKLSCPFCHTQFTPDINGKGNEGVQETKFNKPKTIINEAQGYLNDGKAWLVVHDEKTKQQTYELKPGKQLIGRKDPNKPCDWMIETMDMYMSRNHFTIEIKEKTKSHFSYILADYKSKNHTHIDQKVLGAGDEYYLKDGAVIQAGETKIVFRTRESGANDATEATQIVTAKKYDKTVLIR